MVKNNIVQRPMLTYKHLMRQIVYNIITNKVNNLLLVQTIKFFLNNLQFSVLTIGLNINAIFVKLDF